MPNVTTLRVSDSNRHFRPAEQMAAVATMAVLAPRLVDPTLDFRLNRQMAARLTEHLPYLRSLRLVGARGVGDIVDDDDDDDDDDVRAAVWAALPWSRLTSLQAADTTSHARLPSHLSSLPWLQMRELRGVELPFDYAEQLAAGLPNLQLLNASPKGQWDPTRAVFRQLKQLRLEGCEDGLSGARFAELFPVVERCVLEAELDMDQLGLFYNVEGMTDLTHLCIYNDVTPTPQLARTFEAVLIMTMMTMPMTVSLTSQRC